MGSWMATAHTTDITMTDQFSNVAFAYRNRIRPTRGRDVCRNRVNVWMSCFMVSGHSWSAPGTSVLRPAVGGTAPEEVLMKYAPTPPEAAHHALHPHAARRRPRPMCHLSNYQRETMSELPIASRNINKLLINESKGYSGRARVVSRRYVTEMLWVSAHVSLTSQIPDSSSRTITNLGKVHHKYAHACSLLALIYAYLHYTAGRGKYGKIIYCILNFIFKYFIPIKVLKTI